MDPKLGRVGNAVSLALTLISVAFIAALLWGEREALSTFRPGLAGIAVLALCAVAYAFLGWLLSNAWRRLLIWSGEVQVRGADTLRVYAQTQLAKYIPGNVAQLVSRQAIGRQVGWTHTGLLLSAAFELITLVSVGAAIAAINIAASGGDGVIDPLVLWSVGAALVLSAFLLVHSSPRFVMRFWPATQQRMNGLKLRNLWPVVFLYVLFFVASGIILIIIAWVALGKQLPLSQWPLLSGLFAVAWIVATLTPGAPSGIGIRETVLVAGLASITTTGSAILIAILLRVVTITGDMVFFLFAGFRPPR